MADLRPAVAAGPASGRALRSAPAAPGWSCGAGGSAWFMPGPHAGHGLLVPFRPSPP